MTTIEIHAFDNQFFHAYIARPQHHSSAPGIVVCQEIFGVNSGMRQICDDLASQGYIAVCPDLFWRQERDIQLSDKTPEEMNVAFKLYEGFNVEHGITDLLATMAAVRKLPECNGSIGTVGYCLGGKLAYLLMARSDADCGVSYYGVGLDELLHEVQDIRRPLLMHIAEQDKFVPAAAQAKILHSVARNAMITAEVYPGVEHAFARPDGVHYDAAAATLANQRTHDFFAAHLGR